MRDILLLTGAALAFASGGVAMKFSVGLTRPWPSVLVFGLFCAGAGMQSLAMRSSEMGTTYLAVLGLEAVLAFGLGIWVFSESVTTARVAAVVLILSGILLLKR